MVYLKYAAIMTADGHSHFVRMSYSPPRRGRPPARQRHGGVFAIVAACSRHHFHPRHVGIAENQARLGKKCIII